MSKQFSIGLDFGTQSVRALVVDINSGRELATAVMAYPHGVMDEALPNGTKLAPDWALQHPMDYLQGIGEVISKAVAQAGIAIEQVAGVGVDFTACTILPIDQQGTPLCMLAEYAGNPHAYVKLWKHHAAQGQADRINQLAQMRGESFLQRYGGKVSSEWMLPKLMQIIEEAPEIYRAADRFMEAADWVILQLTGNERRSACAAGYKGLWHKRDGYPSKEFLKALDPALESVVKEKLSGEIYPIGAKAGEVTCKAAQWSGLPVGTAVSVAIIDAHAALPACGITGPGKLLMVMGTSTCHIVLNENEIIVPGMCGVVEDGVLPGFMGYEAGQSCVGDHFEWFVTNCVPAQYAREAEEAGISIQDLLTEKASRLKAGESGLLALDWWNGNRSILQNANLTGVIMGMTLLTKPEEIYRALIEATAFGTRMIIDTFVQSGVAVDELYACGGIAYKNPMLMQIYADVTGREIRIGKSGQSSALGSAMLGAVAAGASAGGYDSIYDAAKAMGGVKERVYRPNSADAQVYQRLYEQYAKLHDLLGCGGSDILIQLKDIRMSALNV